ncbi:hypothetical protein [Salinarimonas soli]|uniref:Uncharacterized protein n=1 Tax=Salinarimonas soli TaxID=1638099 RepID=A0A5B2VB24_9HYPH|nr:hypothetical protein [Salinarimonas soli]KAA2235928.1 hypothetical protein F0L46_17340 [Salinarimonas soli]
MAAFRFRILTFRAGVQVASVTRALLPDANAAFAEAVERARRAVERQRVPHRVELLDRRVMLDALDILASTAREASRSGL